MSKFTIYSYPNSYRVHKAQIAAAYVGVEIKEPNFVFGKDNESDAFLALNPLGKVPCLETPQGPIFESNAIARYIAGLRGDKQLLGASYYETALVAQWVDFSANELENPRAALIYPAANIMAFNQQVNDAAWADMNIAMTVLNDHLLKNSFVVGKQVTLADIALVSALNELYSKIFAPSYIAKYPNVTRWFTTCCNQPEFIQVLGKVVFNKVENATAAPKASEPQAAAASSTSSSKSSGSAQKEAQPTNPEIEAQGNKVRELKARKAPKEEVQSAIDELVRLKAAAAQSGATPASASASTTSAPEKQKAASEKQKATEPEKQSAAEPAQKDTKKEESKGGKKEAKKDEGKAGKKDNKASEKPQEESSKKAEETSKKGKDAPKGKSAEAAKEKAPEAGGKLDDKAVKACIKEGGKKGQDIAGMATFGVHFFCVTVEAAEGEMKLLDKVLEGMNTEVDPDAEDRKGGAGDLGKMLFNANEHKLVILCHTPKEVTEKATAKEWMEGVLKVTHATVVEESEGIIKAEVANDPDKGIFTLKLRDEGIAASFAFLRSRQLMIEDDSDDENYAAAAGINLNAAPGSDY